MGSIVTPIFEAIGALPIAKVALLTNRRTSFHQITDAIPALDPLYFAWEKNFDTIVGSDYCKANNWIPVACVSLYGVIIFCGQYLMRDRKPLDLRLVLAAWNLFLSLFSFCGMVRVAPHLFYNIYAFGFEETLCRPAVGMYGCGASGLWVQLFILSKIPELFDTVFIVFRKKKLSFLHWYHHLTVLLFCWHSYVTESPSGIYFAAMNYAVHSLMYGYYFLMAVKMLPKWFPPGIVTIAQISQMVVGVALTVISGQLFRSPRTCDVKLENLVAGGVMYASYFLLFIHFAFERYYLGPQRKKLANGGKKAQ